ncbi:HAD family phosphatase [Streptomyces albidoflavus]
MASRFRQLRLVSLNIDGVLLNDTFSPVIHDFITSRGGPYTADVEQRIFSQPREVAGVELARAAGIEVSGTEALRLYFEARDQYVEKNPVRLADGALELLERLRSMGAEVICYGGLGREHFDTYIGSLATYFSAPGYVCTNAFRPGIKEITEDIFELAHDQVLFIDDVARVAQEAMRLGTPFIGHPSTFHASFQRWLMEKSGVRHIVDSLDAVDEDLLLRIDAEAQAGIS